MVPIHKRPDGSHFPSLQRIFPLLSGIGAIDAVFPSVRFTRMISFCKAYDYRTVRFRYDGRDHAGRTAMNGSFASPVYTHITSFLQYLPRKVYCDRDGQIDPSPVVASARNARSGLIIIGSFIQEVPSNMINANINLITIFFMVCYESEFTKV